ncbi:unnamed protein product [Fusarium graminearum]|uniref:Uncharacterized protein n=1 Tax=Gibberella zeae TaxID=5518 RepID=A0A4E9EHH8_GIBZA|nr:unnamed protein product [Fusarium graminearum]
MLVVGGEVDVEREKRGNGKENKEYKRLDWRKEGTATGPTVMERRNEGEWEWGDGKGMETRQGQGDGDQGGVTQAWMLMWTWMRVKECPELELN